MSAPRLDRTTRVTGAFYGRTYNKNTPFYGQDANLAATYAGQRLQQPVSAGLASFADLRDENGPWTWSKAHTLLGDRQDRDKYTPHGDPLSAEDRIPVMKGWDQLATVYALESMTEEMSKLDASTPVGAAKIAAFAREIVKGKKHAYQEEFHDEFVHRFREWLRGNGSEREYQEAGMLSYTGPDSKRCKNKPISDHPSVLMYLSDWQNRVIEYNKKRTVMKLRMGRQGAYGEAASVDDLWKYYKFVVYGVESDEDSLTGIVDDVVREDRKKKPNVVQGPMGAAKVRQAIPADATPAPFVIEPLPPTSDEHIRAEVTQAGLDDQFLQHTPIIPEIGDVRQYELEQRLDALRVKPDPEPIAQADLEKRLDAVRTKPPAAPASAPEPEPVPQAELEKRLDAVRTKPPVKPEPELPAVPKEPVPEVDNSEQDQELERKAEALKKPKKARVPKMPDAPKSEPSDPDAEFRQRMDALAKGNEGIARALEREKARVEELAKKLNDTLEQNRVDMARVTEFFKQLLQQAYVPPPPAAPPPPAPPPVAPQPPVVQPAPVAPPAPPAAPVVQPDQPVPQRVVAPEPTPIAPMTVPQPPPPPPQPDQPVLQKFVSPDPAPLVPLPPPAATAPASAVQHPAPDRPVTPVKRLKPEEMPEAATRNSKSTLVSRFNPLPPDSGHLGEVANEQYRNDITAWNDMLKMYLTQLPAAVEAASRVDSSEHDRARAEFLRRATETLRKEVLDAEAAGSIDAAARQRVRDATHVPNVLLSQGSANAPHLTIPDQSVALRRSGSVQKYAERVRTTPSRKSVSPPKGSPPSRSPPRTPPPAPSPKRKEPITNAKKKKAKKEKTEKDDRITRGRKK